MDYAVGPASLWREGDVHTESMPYPLTSDLMCLMRPAHTTHINGHIHGDKGRSKEWKDNERV